MTISFYNPSISSNTPRRITLIIPPPPSLPLSIIYSHTQTSSRKKLISRFVFLFQVSDHDLITRRASPRPSLSFTQARTPMYTFDCFICASRAVRTLKRRLYTNPRQKESFASLSLSLTRRWKLRSTFAATRLFCPGENVARGVYARGFSHTCTCIIVDDWNSFYCRGRKRGRESV